MIKFSGTVMICLMCVSSVRSLEYEGLLFPAQHIIISTLASGVVIYLQVKEGQYVEKGTVLLIQDPRKDSLQLILAERECEKSKIQKSTEIESAVNYASKKLSYEDRFIKAPINGTIVRITAKEHEYYSAGTTVIEIADLSNLITEINVSQNKIEKVKKGSTVIIVTKGNQEIRGQFYAYNPLAEPGVELLLVKIIMENKYSWCPGTYVKVTF